MILRSTTLVRPSTKTRRTVAVTTSTPDALAWSTALGLADGDARRLVVD